MADAVDLGSIAERRGGSSPLIRTIICLKTCNHAGFKHF